MQLELDARLAFAEARVSRRVLALCIPDLPLQRVLRLRRAVSQQWGRGAERGAPGTHRTPLAVERDGHVLACDAEARERGVRRGDGLAQARAACAGLETVPADDEADRAALEGLAEALLALAPAVEVAWPDVLLLDASGAHLLAREGSDGEGELAARAIALAADLGLRCRAAVASGRGPTRALARHAPVATSLVFRAGAGDGATALAGLPISALELPPPLEERLIALGLRQVGDLSRLPEETLAHRFGAAGLAAWRLAQGDDPSPLVPYVPQRLPEERLELDSPIESSDRLLFGLKRLCDRLAARLGGRGLCATRLALALRLDSCGPSSEVRLEIALASPSNATSRWLLVLRERLDALRLPAAVALAVLGVAEAAPGAAEQLALGDRPEQLEALEVVLTRLAARLGAGAFFAAQPVDRHRPEASYQHGAFAGAKRGNARTGKGRRGRAGSARPQDGASPRQEEAREEHDPAMEASPPASALVRPTRLLPRPQPLVALGEGGRLTALRVGNQTLRVLALSPAERLAGEWWGDPFDRDYHRARVEGLGECWIFRDAGDGRLWLHGFFD